jgi:hypothetical protein
MTLLEQLEYELDRVKEQLRRLTREQAVLTEQITRLRIGTPPEIVCAALQAAIGVRLDVYFLSHGGDGDPAPPSERPPASHREGARRGSRP